MTWVVLAVAGGLGALVRGRVADALVGRSHGALWATATVNLAGALALGLLLGTSEAGSTAAVVVGTGFLGGLTTFSTWLTGADAAPRAGVRGVAVAGQLVAGPALAALGFWLAGG